MQRILATAVIREHPTSPVVKIELRADKDAFRWYTAEGEDAEVSASTKKEAIEAAASAWQRWEFAVSEVYPGGGLRYYTLVAFGDPNRTVPARFPGKLVSANRDDIVAALERWRERAEQWAGSALNACSIRIYGYATRKQAQNGSVSDEIGKNGRVE